MTRIVSIVSVGALLICQVASRCSMPTGGGKLPDTLDPRGCSAPGGLRWPLIDLTGDCVSYSHGAFLNKYFDRWGCTRPGGVTDSSDPSYTFCNTYSPGSTVPIGLESLWITGNRCSNIRYEKGCLFYQHENGRSYNLDKTGRCRGNHYHLTHNLGQVTSGLQNQNYEQYLLNGYRDPFYHPEELGVVNAQYQGSGRPVNYRDPYYRPEGQVSSNSQYPNSNVQIVYSSVPNQQGGSYIYGGSTDPVGTREHYEEVIENCRKADSRQSTIIQQSFETVGRNIADGFRNLAKNAITSLSGINETDIDDITSKINDDLEVALKNMADHITYAQNNPNDWRKSLITAQDEIDSFLRQIEKHLTAAGVDKKDWERMIRRARDDLFDQITNSKKEMTKVEVQQEECREKVRTATGQRCDRSRVDMISKFDKEVNNFIAVSSQYLQGSNRDSVNHILMNTRDSVLRCFEDNRLRGEEAERCSRRAIDDGINRVGAIYRSNETERLRQNLFGIVAEASRECESAVRKSQSI